jgi:hypothetical protein
VREDGCRAVHTPVEARIVEVGIVGAQSISGRFFYTTCNNIADSGVRGCRHDRPRMEGVRAPNRVTTKGFIDDFCVCKKMISCKVLIHKMNRNEFYNN